MSASRVTTLSPDVDAIGDWSAPEGSEPWAKALRVGLQRCVDKVEMYPDELKGLVDKALAFSAWTKLLDARGAPFPTFEAFCAARKPHGIGRPYALIKPYLVAAHGGDEVRLAALTTRAEAAPTHSDAGAKGGRGKKKAAYDGKGLTPKAGNASEYLAARIARDAPDVHDAMKRGEFKSVRAAAKAAGLVKDPDPVKVAKRALAKVPPERASEVIAPLAKAAAPPPPALDWSRELSRLDVDGLTRVLRTAQTLLLARGVEVSIRIGGE